jgi:HKD family nuclease
VEVKFLNARAVRATLSRLIPDHDEFHWAVAWGSMTDVAVALMDNRRKFRDVTFGVSFSQTDPDLVDALVGVSGARVATKFEGGTYHPKIFGFRSKSRAEAIVGSANFTFGGLGKNHEAAVHIKGSVSDPLFLELFKFTKKSAELGELVTPEYAVAYRASHTRAARMAKPPRDPMVGLELIKPAGFASPLVSMTWPEYVAQVNESSHHTVDESLSLLRIAQQLFSSVKSFADLDAGPRKAIAGILGKRQKITNELNREWGWFGSMKGMGDFANRIDENDKYLAAALDGIPQKGEVTKGHFQKFVRNFEKAFSKSSRKGGVPTASRLLAMKRPDTFVCISRPNLLLASERMGFSRSTLKLDDYWEKVIEVIRLSEWYNADKPQGAEGELWESRVAMLDAILYNP